MYYCKIKEIPFHKNIYVNVVAELTFAINSHSETLLSNTQSYYYEYKDFKIVGLADIVDVSRPRHVKF